MEYRLATKDDMNEIFDITQRTIKQIYPNYYRAEIVEMFQNLHSISRIEKDITGGNISVLLENDMIVGTGTLCGNHITRVFVLPEYQKRGFGTYIMDQLESEVAKNYSMVELDASLPAGEIYYKRGYKTVSHGEHKCASDVILIYEIMQKQLNQLRLRPYKNCDAAEIVSWFHDEVSFHQWCADRFTSFPISAEDLNQHYMSFINSDSFYPMTAYDQNGVKGHLFLRFLDEEKQVLRFGFVVVNDQMRGQGYGKKMLQLALDYAFHILKVQKVTLGVFENNSGAYKCYKSIGFHEGENGSFHICEILGESWKCIDLVLEK